MPAIVWKGYLSFGLVSFPVRLFVAARPQAVHFHLLHKKDLSRVKEVWYCAAENKRIDRSEMVKGYETSKEDYVVVDDEELKNIAPPTASTMEILRFVKKNEVDPILFETSYYLAADDKINKPYALFLGALSETKSEAIAKLTMHNREHTVLIRPAEGGLVLHTLYYAHELNQANRTKIPKTKFTAKEMELAKSLVAHMSGAFHLGEYHDSYRENVERLIEEKKRGRKITAVSQTRKAPVIDLMEALKRSLKSAPAAASGRSGRKSSSRRTARRAA